MFGNAPFTGSSAASNVQPLLAKIRRNMQDCQILVLGDSTGDDTTEWPYLLAQQLGVLFPTHSLYYAAWSSTAYGTATQLTTGTGAQKITIYNCSVSGSKATYSLGGRWAAAVAALSPDLIFVSYGHNVASSWAVTHWPVYQGHFLALTESLLEQCPNAGMILTLQNPETANTYLGQLHPYLESIARMRGYGVLNVWQAFKDYGSAWSTDLMADAVHPNSAGQAIWTNEALKLFRSPWDGFVQARPLLPCSFGQKGFSLIKNGDFSAFSSNPPDNWTAGGTLTIAKDSTNYESANGYAVSLTPTAGAAAGMYQALPIKLVKGKLITALARIYVPSGCDVNCGALGLYDSVASSVKSNDLSRDLSGGAFHWMVVSHVVDPAATSARVYIWADTGTANQSCTVDYVAVSVGPLPMR